MTSMIAVIVEAWIVVALIAFHVIAVKIAKLKKRRINRLIVLTPMGVGTGEPINWIIHKEVVR